MAQRIANQRAAFLSTPSARRATILVGELAKLLSQFLSTPSARRATQGTVEEGIQHCISIHALREEGDVSDAVFDVVQLHFYPRPPRGGRPAGAGFLFVRQ